jgi:hypothetical protein
MLSPSLDLLEVAPLVGSVEGSFASVSVAAPAAAVVFTRDVDTRTANDQRLKEIDAPSRRPPTMRSARNYGRRRANSSEHGNLPGLPRPS